MTINRKFFFDQCRQTLFTGKLNKGQVEGLSFILNVWESYLFDTPLHKFSFEMTQASKISNHFKSKSCDFRRIKNATRNN